MGESQKTWLTKLGGWPRGTREGFSARKMCSDLHVGKIFLHHFPHMRIKPKTRAPITSLLLQGRQCANPVVGFQVERFLTFCLA